MHAILVKLIGLAFAFVSVASGVAAFYCEMKARDRRNRYGGHRAVPIWDHPRFRPDGVRWRDRALLFFAVSFVTCLTALCLAGD